MKLVAKDYILLAVVTSGLAIASAILLPWRAAAALTAAVGAVSFLIVLCYRHLMSLMRSLAADQSSESMVHYRQLESSIWLASTLKVRQPLPFMRGMAISPDFGALLAQTLLSHNPRTIVELGCGTSTLVSCYILEQLGGDGRVVSIDHDEKFAAICRQQLLEHGLQHRVTIYHCPLVSQTVEGQRVEYYDLSRASLPDAIDVLVVDGPPQWTGRLARYPAFPLLGRLLTPSAVVLVDDASRPDEKTMVKRWLTDNPGLEERYLETEKGTAILKYQLK